MTPARIKRLEELRALARELRAERSRTSLRSEEAWEPIKLAGSGTAEERFAYREAAADDEHALGRIERLQEEWAAALWGPDDD